MNIYKDYLNFLKDTVLLLKKKHKYGFDINDIFSKITLEPPKNLSHGDMSTNVAMLLAPKFNKKPYEIAEIFKEEIKHIFAKVWVPVIHKSEIRNEGDYRTSQIAFQNILIVTL